MLTPIISTLALALFAWKRNDSRLPKTRRINTFAGGIYGFVAGWAVASLFAAVPLEEEKTQIACEQIVRPTYVYQRNNDNNLPAGITCFRIVSTYRQPTGVTSLFFFKEGVRTSYEVFVNVPSNSKQ
jgi:hypothetical protein